MGHYLTGRWSWFIQAGEKGKCGDPATITIASDSTITPASMSIPTSTTTVTLTYAPTLRGFTRARCIEEKWRLELGYVRWLISRRVGARMCWRTCYKSCHRFCKSFLSDTGTSLLISGQIRVTPVT